MHVALEMHNSECHSIDFLNQILNKQIYWKLSIQTYFPVENDWNIVLCWMWRKMTVFATQESIETIYLEIVEFWYQKCWFLWKYPHFIQWRITIFLQLFGGIFIILLFRGIQNLIMNLFNLKTEYECMGMRIQNDYNHSSWIYSITNIRN